MITSEIPAPSELHTRPERPARGDTLRLILIIAVVLLVIGLIAVAGLSGLAADPMAGT
jgi:Tfp pilus assembly protein PilX